MIRQNRSLKSGRAQSDGEPMRRFFYDIRRGADLIQDPDGELQPSLERAMTEAVSAAKDLVIDAIHGLREIDDDEVLIRDDGGFIVGRVALIDVLPVRRPEHRG